MDFDAFNAGVDFGGLRSKNDIQVLVCYLLCGVNAPLSKDDIVSVLCENGFANYFEVMDSLSVLSNAGSISIDENDNYSANELTHEISMRLNTTLPNSIREQAVSFATELLSAAKRERENKVEITEISNGYKIECHISGGKHDLMSFSLYVPDLQQSKLVRKNFLKNPGLFYKMILTLSTGNNDIAKSLIDNDQKPL